jgi:hypothetical protein
MAVFIKLNYARFSKLLNFIEDPTIITIVTLFLFFWSSQLLPLLLLLLLLFI